tara:strand:+ start:170 stop:331 length:162 start_codon:yes stop_codon:yes gene_type:complete
VTFKLYDYIAIFVFTHLFYYGIMGIIYGGFIGGIIVLVTWEFWKLYEQWRINK